MTRQSGGSLYLHLYFGVLSLWVWLHIIGGGVGVDGLIKPFAPAYPHLQRYNVDRRSVSVSGFSNGGLFAAYLAFIYSSVFHAAGVFAGGPYPAAQPVFAGQVTRLFKTETLYPFIEEYAARGAIDPLRNLRGMRVYAYLGLFDFGSNIFSMSSVVEEFRHYGASVRNQVWTKVSWHCMPTDNYPPRGDYVPIVGSAGAICNTGYQGVNDMFDHFYGADFAWPVSNNATPTGQLFKFDQNEFFNDGFAEGNGFTHAAFMYVPRVCETRQVPCKLHIALHGAGVPLAARLFFDGFNPYVQFVGYLQAADANNIIVLFPECSVPNVLSFDVFVGWWTTNVSWKERQRNFLYKNGTHALAIRRMVAKVLGDESSVI